MELMHISVDLGLQDLLGRIMMFETEDDQFGLLEFLSPLLAIEVVEFNSKTRFIKDQLIGRSKKLQTHRLQDCHFEDFKIKKNSFGLDVIVVDCCCLYFCIQVDNFGQSIVHVCCIPVHDERRDDDFD
ncbi:OLC1v1012128C1 [Oldenlandia corymbosa var. corymbosa]|uniref:OLC1v1012128C1 n=1 Tax=Oldenlandia corymbosa var. corymbosa TaxID=529605 RepID=A0AAV1DV99_OLDCO|nr:OLC1v1012128C1 [Oldenlandia corymbosa var. corymbosa]